MDTSISEIWAGIFGIIIMFIFYIVLISVFAGLSKQYIKEIRQRFPRLNFKINCILFFLIFLEWIAGIIISIMIGVKPHGGGMGMVLIFCICKYFIAKRIVNNDSDYGYASNTILVYIIASIIRKIIGLFLGGILLWNLMFLV